MKNFGVNTYGISKYQLGRSNLLIGMIKTFIKRLFPDYSYRNLRNQMTNLYYKQDWDELEKVYRNSTLPKITLDIEMLYQLKHLNIKDSNLLKGAIVWQHSNNADIEWIMNIIMRNAYFNFNYVKETI